MDRLEFESSPLLEAERWMGIADCQRGDLRTAAPPSAAADKWEADLFKCGQGRAEAHA